ncbi:MAG: SulP family inorganic anion transporter [Saccharofermentanales bacterium]
MFKPKILEVLPDYSAAQFSKDLIAGVIVGIIAIPLSIALAISSGVSPQQGLYTAIIAGFVISLLGGSRVQIGGPTGAFVIIIYGIIQEFGYAGLAVATIMAGIFLVLMGILKFGSLIKYIPVTITTGFTSGIAVVIFSQQLNDFLGLGIAKMPSEFLEKMHMIFTNLSGINYYSLALGIASVVIIALWPRVNKRIPGPLIAIICTTLIVYFFKFPVETIGSRFPNLAGGFPSFTIPAIDFSQISSLIQPAITIALLAGIESLMSAVVSDKLVVDKHNSNTELIALGIANIASVMFGGIPATGAIARTAANVKNGGRTPVAGMIHSITVLVIMLLLIPLAKLIPMSALAAILVVVAYNMSEWREFKALLKAGKSDILVLVATFLLTVFIDLVVAIEIGFALAVVMFFVSMTKKSNIVLNKELSTGTLSVVSINGPFFFAAADTFVDFIKENCRTSKIIILSLENSLHMDASGIGALEEIHEFCSIYRIRFIITDTKTDVDLLMHKTQFIEVIGKENIYTSTDEAIVHIGMAASPE